MLTFLVLLLCNIGIAQTNFGVRQYLSDLTPQEQQELADLILEYTDVNVIGTHAATMWSQAGMTSQERVHGNQNFLPFHREYVAGLEGFLVLKGKSQYVPLPKWRPETAVPQTFQRISQDCDNAYPGYNCNQLVGVGSNSQRAVINSFNGSNQFDFNNICNHTEEDIIGVGFGLNAIFSVIETPWHNYVHGDIGGVMNSGKSPGANIFMPWHAYVDDVWKEWQCECNDAPAVDLWLRGTPMHLANDPAFIETMSMDRGEQPNDVSTLFYKSEDIWVRNQPDGFTTDVHQNPIYNGPNNPSYAYVRIRNKGCQASTGGQVSLYWAKAGTHSGWPDVYQGNVFSGANNDIPMGGHIQTITIPSIPAGGSTIVEFLYQPVNPLIFQEISDNDAELWHSCLLAVIDAPNQNDPVIDPVPEAEFISYNNNVALRNLSVICTSCLVAPKTGATVHVGNLGIENTRSYDFKFKSEDFEIKNLWEEAEITAQLSDNVWNKWLEGGMASTNIEIINEEERVILITNNNASLDNLTFTANEFGTIHLNFNFLTEEVTAIEEYMYNLIQLDKDTDLAVGGETYQVTRNMERDLFLAHGDVTPQGNQMVFTATDINESATYNWYDPDGKLIYTGKTVLLSPELVGIYKLEVIADADGYKDYSEVTVDSIQDNHIVSLAPNPASVNVLVTYKIDQASSAYIHIASLNTNTSYNYIVALQNDQQNIDVSAYTTGQYVVQLIVDGKVVNYQYLIVE